MTDSSGPSRARQAIQKWTNWAHLSWTHAWTREPDRDHRPGPTPQAGPPDRHERTGPTPVGPRIMVAPAQPGPTSPPARTATPRKLRALAGPTRTKRAAVAALVVTAALLLASVVIAPSALSSQDIIGWARSAAGLRATGVWPYVAFWSLDAAAVYCVLMGVYAGWVRGESPGAFRWGVWIFAGFSATANYAFGQAPEAGASQWWFYPAMSLLGPALLEVTMHRVRRWVAEGRGRRSRTGVQFGFTEWLPVIGHFRETFGAWRLARMVDMTINPDGTPFTGNLAARARFTYRTLCPRGELRVFKILRAQQAAALDGVAIVLPGLIPADLLPTLTSSGDLPVEWGTDPRTQPPARRPQRTPEPPARPRPTPEPQAKTPAAPERPREAPAPDPDDDDTAAGVEITEDEVNRLLAKHAGTLFAIREAYGTDEAGKTWLDCEPAISRRAAATLAGIPDGRAARELHTCLKHLRADRHAINKLPTPDPPS